MPRSVLLAVTGHVSPPSPPPPPRLCLTSLSSLNCPTAPHLTTVPSPPGRALPPFLAHQVVPRHRSARSASPRLISVLSPRDRVSQSFPTCSTSPGLVAILRPHGRTSPPSCTARPHLAVVLRVAWPRRKGRLSCCIAWLQGETTRWSRCREGGNTGYPTRSGKRRRPGGRSDGDDWD